MSTPASTARAATIPATASAPGGVEAVDRAFSILATFRQGSERQSLAQLATSTGLYKSTILRLARSLEQAGFLSRAADGCFSLGVEPLRLAAICRRAHPAREEEVRAALRRLRDATGETASLFQRVGNGRICVFREESAHAIRDHVLEGDVLPLDVGAAGHVLTRFAAAGAAQRPALLRQMPIASFGERDPETAAIATPVFAHDGLCGALAISGPRSRLSPGRMKTIRPTLQDAAQQLTWKLGGRELNRAWGRE